MAVDYSRLAAGYDRSRADDRIDREYWLRGLIEVGEIEPGDRILDLGAGTGRFSRLLSESNPVVALDASGEMLAIARGKGPFAIVQGDAHRLPFRDETFDTTTVVMVLHHLSDYRSAFREIARASRRIVIVTSDMARRRLGIMEEAFPSLLRIDRARFPPIADVARALELVRFRRVRIEERPFRRAITPKEQIERVRHRYLSTFDLLPPGEFERGLRFLEAELPRHGDRFEIDASFTFLAGAH